MSLDVDDRLIDWAREGQDAPSSPECYEALCGECDWIECGCACHEDAE